MGRAPVITAAKGNLLEADVDAVVNTVNTVGVMGKGIALQFKRAYPAMFKSYQTAVKDGAVRLGRMHVWSTGQIDGPRYVINFPTKGHWRGRSRLEDIQRGLDDLARVIAELEITSIAVPPLGCGSGGLNWTDVEPLIRRTLGVLSDLDIELFAPSGAPSAEEMHTAGPPPEMTPGRAALIALVAAYEQHAMAMPSLIELQKLMYFLQEAGEPLKLNYARNRYGPYADNLRHVLQHVEGHYLSGYGDGSNPVLEAEPLSLLPGALQASAPVLDQHPETRQRIERVLELAGGFESSYGLELLASVHWVMKHEPAAGDNPSEAARAVQNWTHRKARLFTEEHIRTAWRALNEGGWTPALAGVT